MWHESLLRTRVSPATTRASNNGADDDSNDDDSGNISVDLPGPENNLANVLTDEDAESTTPRCLDDSLGTRPTSAG